MAKLHINRFLDEVDNVLNSNTFLIKLELDFSDSIQCQHQFTSFAKSEKLKSAVLKQDIERDWFNYHSVSNKGEYIIKEQGPLVKQNDEITPSELTKEKGLRHLSAMLTVEQNDHSFWSPYDKQIERNKAEALVKNFIDELTCQQDFKILTLNTSFMYNKVDKYSESQYMAYFEGDYGSDSATIIKVADGTAFLLLTNGID